ncbi:MAG: DUF3137 domain-containing protein [Campylobacter sp.]|nr:DUF3137 domain-containing protein [Campylobacter sp.]
MIEFLIFIYLRTKFELNIFIQIRLNRQKLAKISLNWDFSEILQNIQKDHAKCKRKIFMEFAFAFFTFVIIPFGIFEISNRNEFALVGLIPWFMVLIFVHFGRIQLFWTEYKRLFKQNFISQIVKDINPNFSYQYDKFLTKNSGILRYDYTRNEDFIGGKYENVDFELVEFYKGDTYKKQKGAIFACDFYKDFDFDLKIENKKIQMFENTEVLDNIEFNEIFIVTGKDKVEIRYLLTPSFMERLLQIAKNPDFGIVSAAFSQNKFYVFLENNKDLFEPYLFFAPNLYLAKYYKMEILNFLSLIDELNLTLNIYPKTALKNQKFTR